MRKQNALDVADSTSTKAFTARVMATQSAHNGPAEGTPGSEVQRGIVRINGTGEVRDDLQTARRVRSATELSPGTGLGASCNSCAVLQASFACTIAERIGQGLLVLSPVH